MNNFLTEIGNLMSTSNDPDGDGTRDQNPAKRRKMEPEDEHIMALMNEIAIIRDTYCTTTTVGGLRSNTTDN